MMKWIKNLLCKKKINSLEDEIKTLRERLDQRQEVINQTNAYWKKKIHALQIKNKKKKPESKNL